MSDDFHRPTLTFPDGAYNATQVRLYGIAANGGWVFANNSKTLDKTMDADQLHVEVTVGEASSDIRQNTEINEHIRRLKERNKIENDQELFAKIANKSIEWGIDPVIPVGYAFQLAVETKKFGSIVISTAISIGDAIAKGSLISSGIIVGYSYEGHCYDLPKPKVMIIPKDPIEIPSDDCGYDKKASADYKVWIVDKLDECVEFEMNQGFVEQLVLEANLPGKRAPSMYAAKMMMGHRSGRLSE
jgi:hypothetical protein